MNITEIKIYKNKIEESNLKAIANIVINDCFVIHNLKIVQGKERLFVAMPTTKKNDKFIDVCHPISKEFREQLETAIINEFNK